MRLHKVLMRISALGIAALLMSCGYEEGFEHTTQTNLVPVNNSGVKGSVVIGYGIDNPTFRVRVALRGLSRNVGYQMRFFDAHGCDEEKLRSAVRTDAKRDDPPKAPEAWGFDTEPIVLTGNFFGRAKEEFQVAVPTASSIYWEPSKYPTVVIYALADLKGKKAADLTQVACGTISEIPTNHRPHT